MSLRSEVFTADTNWTCPDGVTLVRVLMQAAGGAGGAWANTFSGASMGGGGAGEICVGFPVPVTPGVSYFIDVGSGGDGGGGSSTTNDATAGEDASFENFTMLGGGRGLGPENSGGAGGGPNGNFVGHGVAGDGGLAESPVHFGGAGGGGSHAAGGTQIGQYPGGTKGNPADGLQPGGGGAGSLFGSGGIGGDAHNSGVAANGRTSGGGGAGCNVGGVGQPTLGGGDGTNAIVVLFWASR